MNASSTVKARKTASKSAAATSAAPTSARSTRREALAWRKSLPGKCARTARAPPHARNAGRLATSEIEAARRIAYHPGSQPVRTAFARRRSRGRSDRCAATRAVFGAVVFTRRTGVELFDIVRFGTWLFPALGFRPCRWRQRRRRAHQTQALDLLDQPLATDAQLARGARFVPG